LIGPTGAGKSLTMNFLAGVAIEKTAYGHLDVVNAMQMVSSVGHGDLSETTDIRVYHDASSGLTFCDTPGFADTGGAGSDLPNTARIYLALRRLTSVRFVLLLSIEELSAGKRGNYFGQILPVLRRLLGDVPGGLRSVLVLFTHRYGITDAWEDMHSCLDTKLAAEKRRAEHARADIPLGPVTSMAIEEHSDNVAIIEHILAAISAHGSHLIIRPLEPDTCGAVKALIAAAHGIDGKELSPPLTQASITVLEASCAAAQARVRKSAEDGVIISSFAEVLWQFAVLAHTLADDGVDGVESGGWHGWHAYRRFEDAIITDVRIIQGRTLAALTPVAGAITEEKVKEARRGLAQLVDYPHPLNLPPKIASEKASCCDAIECKIQASAARLLEEVTLLDADGCTPSSGLICRALNVLQRIEVHLSIFCFHGSEACCYQAAVSRLAEVTKEANAVASALVSKLEEGTMPSEDFLQLRKALLWLEMMKTLPEHEQLDGQPAFGYPRVADAHRCFFAKLMVRIRSIAKQVTGDLDKQGCVIVCEVTLDDISASRKLDPHLQFVGELWSIRASFSSYDSLLRDFMQTMMELYTQKKFVERYNVREELDRVKGLFIATFKVPLNSPFLGADCTEWLCIDPEKTLTAYIEKQSLAHEVTIAKLAELDQATVELPRLPWELEPFPDRRLLKKHLQLLGELIKTAVEDFLNVFDQAVALHANGLIRGLGDVSDLYRQTLDKLKQVLDEDEPDPKSIRCLIENLATANVSSPGLAALAKLSLASRAKAKGHDSNKAEKCGKIPGQTAATNKDDELSDKRTWSALVALTTAFGASTNGLDGDIDTLSGELEGDHQGVLQRNTQGTLAALGETSSLAMGMMVGVALATLLFPLIRLFLAGIVIAYKYQQRSAERATTPLELQTRVKLVMGNC
jgi:hypothetical protein